MLVTLVGYRGTGKSTVARLLSRRLGLSCWDADAEIERRAGCSIKQIFSEQGEEGFRALEEQVIAELVQQPAAVLAVGGGAVLREANRLAIGRGTVIWLTARPETILTRVTADPSTGERRPNLTTSSGLDEIETLLAAREQLYRQSADHVVSTESQRPDQVAAEIVRLLGGPPSTASGSSEPSE